MLLRLRLLSHVVDQIEQHNGNHSRPMLLSLRLLSHVVDQIEQHNGNHSRPMLLSAFVITCHRSNRAAQW